MNYRHDLPEWLGVGLRLLDAKNSANPQDWQDTLSKQVITPQVFNRFMRVAKFLKTNYPNSLDGGEKFTAGSAVMLEFIKLHDFSTNHAAELYRQVFQGQISVRELRQKIEQIRRERENEYGPRPAALHKSQRHADFSKKVIQMILQNPSVLGVGEVSHIEEAPPRHALMPKLMAHTALGTVAVDIRSSDVNAARSAGAAAAVFVSRIAVLLMKFDRVVLLLPKASKDYAVATMDLLSSWTNHNRKQLDKVQILLVGSDSVEIYK